MDVGEATSELLDHAMPKSEANYVMLTSYDGYTTNLPLADFAARVPILATRWEGMPQPWRPDAACCAASLLLEGQMAAPLNLADKQDTEEKGNHMYGDPWREQRYSEE